MYSVLKSKSLNEKRNTLFFKHYFILENTLEEFLYKSKQKMPIEIANKEVFFRNFYDGLQNCQPEVKHVNYR